MLGKWALACEDTRREGMFYSTVFHWALPVASGFLVVHDWKLAKHLLSKDCWGMFRKGKSYRLAVDLIGDKALLSAPDSEHWRWQRRLASGAFSRSLLSSTLVPQVHKAVDDLSQRWEAAADAMGGDRPTTDFHKDALALTLQVLGTFAFGFDLGNASGDSTPKEQAAVKPLNDAFEVILRRMTRFGRNPLLLLTRKFPTEAGKEYWQALQTLECAVRKSIDSRMSEGDLGQDLLGQLLRAAESDGERMGNDLIFDNLKTFLFAGHDTTATSLAWLVYLMATHPAEEAKVLDELRSLPHDTPPSAEALENLPYLDVVVREGLRLYPPAGFTRETIADMDIGGYRVGKGTEIFMFPYLTHRNPELFEDPERFWPERWLGDGFRGKAPESCGWMPFSVGARNCVGSQLAKLEIKAALHALLSRYSFEPAPDDGDGPPKVVLYMTLVPNAVRLIPRPRGHWP